jgi:NAD(P)H-dependent FMN reductase
LKDKKHEVIILDPLELNLPMLKQPLHFYPDQNQAPAQLRELDEKIKSADAYIIITPEYNRQLPPALTNLIDYFPPRSFAFKSSAIVTYSLGAGGANAAGQARTLLVEVGAPPIPYIMHLNEVTKKLNDSGEPTDEYLHKQIDKLATQLDFYAVALKRHRAAVGEPEPGFALSLKFETDILL